MWFENFVPNLSANLSILFGFSVFELKSSNSNLKLYFAAVFLNLISWKII